MPWPIPAPGDISNRAAAVYEQAFPPDPANDEPGIDARSPNTVATTNTRITEMAMQDLYFFQGDQALELMPDTAQTNLPRHASIWGVPRVQAASATGNVVVAGTNGDAVPTDLIFTLAGSTTNYVATNTSDITIAGGTASIPVAASLAGTAGNLAAGTVLTLSSPVEGLTSLTGTVDSNGITGGLDLETPDSWRANILAKIRYEPAGGDFDDYVQWAQEALPGVALAACPAGACGGGVVSVVVMMGVYSPSPTPGAPQVLTGFAPPTSGQLAVIQSYIGVFGQPGGKRPVTANVTVYAGTLNPVNVTLHLNPDTPTIRAAASAALALSFLQDAALGGTTYLSRLNNAVSSSDGETSHEMSVPAADVAAPSLFALNTLGTVSFD
jgi:uncharacterized phage protein gp47/JayE